MQTWTSSRSYRFYGGALEGSNSACIYCLGSFFWLPDLMKLTLRRPEKIFVETGHGLTDLVIDATEFKLQSVSNFELNSLRFLNYKNTQTEKALAGISPHDGGILFSDIFPGSILIRKLLRNLV